MIIRFDKLFDTFFFKHREQVREADVQFAKFI